MASSVHLTNSLELLAKVRRERTQLDLEREAEERSLVKDARNRGASWAEIGEALGISEEKAWREYR